MEQRLLVKEIAKRLSKAYGPRQRNLDDPFDVLIRTILSQNTSDTNSHRAFRQLKKRFPTSSDLASAPVHEIEEAIRTGGLYQRKARVIKSVARAIQDRGVDLNNMDPSQAYRFLTSLQGVGPKTAGCVLLFGLGIDVLPVDTHVYRVSRRLGLIGQVPRERAQAELEQFVPPEIRYELHLLIIEHGRRVCKAQRPSCDRCVLVDLCPYGAEVLSKGDSEDQKR